jgi:enoyl-CoA hydratase/carnithine racemase
VVDGVRVSEESVKERFGDVWVGLGDDYVATVEMRRPPNNFFDVALIRSLADAYEALDADDGCRAIVLCSEGRNFCAGMDFARRPSTPESGATGDTARLYHEAARLFDARTPVVAAIQGTAVGGGLGLACSADFRVACPQSRFSANFARLGLHHGFGLTVTLPAIVGRQRALELLYTGRRVPGEDAARLGLCDRLAEGPDPRPAAHAFAAEIAESAPLAIRSIRETMRGGLAGEVRTATERELREQDRLWRTADWSEGVRSTAERRPPRFHGR